MNFSQAVERIGDVWKDLEEGQVCIALLEHLSGLNELPAAVSVDLLRTAGGASRFSEEAVAGALGYLTGYDIHFLDVTYTYRRSDGDVVPLARDAMAAIVKGDLRDPDTGELDPDLTARVFLSFPISEMGKRILASRDARSGCRPGQHA